MKYFLDTEFIEGFKKPFFGKKRHFIDLIQIGIVAEDGTQFRMLSSEYNYNDANEWVKENVILKLYTSYVHGDNRNRYSVSNFHKYYGKSNEEIKKELLLYFDCWRDSFSWRRMYDEPVEVYAYYADYDWVLFCSLFGRMIDLPKGFPMYCIDLKQTTDEKVNRLTNNDFFTHFHVTEWLTFAQKLDLIKNKNPKYPKQENEHDALADAKWNYELYKFLNTLTPTNL